jgi:HK97 gp10 family phage protein
VQFDLEWRGDEAVRRKLAKARKSLEKKLLRKAMRDAMKLVQALAVRLAPREKGLLRRTIKVRAGPRSRSSISILVVVGEGWYRGQSYYAAMVEYGTRYQHAQRYLSGAYLRGGPAARDQVVRVVWGGTVRELT